MIDTDRKAEIAVIGGTGFYSFLDDIEEIKLNTPYGFTSDLISLGSLSGKKIAFLPRHGKQHQYPPHMVNYRANLWALKQLGVSRVLGPLRSGAAFSLMFTRETLCFAINLWIGLPEEKIRFSTGQRQST
jgi:5'-methylthioadenosine phosphorylase